MAEIIHFPKKKKTLTLDDDIFICVATVEENPCLCIHFIVGTQGIYCAECGNFYEDL